MENKSTNNSTLNNSREVVNGNISKYRLMGKTFKQMMESTRSFRSI